MSRPALFHRRNERIDWRRMAAVDVDRIARDFDFQALQEHLEQITFCNIDNEVDSRTIDPNFVKLYKLSQMTIEYLLTCQEQLTQQLGDFEQLKNRVDHDQHVAQKRIEILENELVETKKELKKRRKMLETQQRLLFAQSHNYHACPVCSHAFLNEEYLKKHMSNRHKDFVPTSRTEKDVELAKEIQRLKDELMRKENDFQTIRTQKAIDAEKVHGFEKLVRELKEEKRDLSTKLEILTNRLNVSQTNASASSNDRQLIELSRENQRLRGELDDQKDLRQKLKKLEEKNADLKTRVDQIQRTPSDVTRPKEETRPTKTPPTRRPSPPVVEETRPAKRPLPSEPVPVEPRPIRPVVKPNGLLLPEFCPTLEKRLTENPKFLTKFHHEAKRDFHEELEKAEDLGILPEDSRLSDLDCRTKMEKVLKLRRTIQNDLPNFERVRREIAERLDRLVNDRVDVRRSDTSIRSGASKLVKFKDETRRQSSDEADDLDDSRPIRPTTSDPQPSPRKHLPSPSHGISALVSEAARQPAPVRPMQRVTNFDSDSDDEKPVAPPPSSKNPDKTKIIQQKLDESHAKGSKPTIAALIGQGGRPSLINTKRTEDDDDQFDDDETLTTLHTANGKRPSIDYQPPSALRQLVNKNPLSSAEMSQYTYESLIKSNGVNSGRGHEFRRPPTADSAKTSNMDSDDNLEDDVST